MLTTLGDLISARFPQIGRGVGDLGAGEWWRTGSVAYDPVDPTNTSIVPPDDLWNNCNLTTGANCRINGQWVTNPYANFLSTNTPSALAISMALISGESEMVRANQWLNQWVIPFSTIPLPGAPIFIRIPASTSTGSGSGSVSPTPTGTGTSTSTSTGAGSTSGGGTGTGDSEIPDDNTGIVPMDHTTWMIAGLAGLAVLVLVMKR